MDASRAKLIGGLPDDAVILDKPGLAFGEAVNSALTQLPAYEPGDEVTQWIWLLHDDSAPRPETLERLLDAVEKAPSATIAGPKQMDAERPERLLEVGLTATRSGHRFSRVGTDEVDQGQLDAVSDSLGVNTAGMLVRRDIFERIGGFDPALPGIGDDIDLGRRMWLAGHRVIVVPDAVVEHHSDDVESVTGPRVTARAAAYTRLKYARAWVVPFLAVWMMVAGLGRALGRLVAKDPRGAGIELGAGFTGLGRFARVFSARRNVSRHRSVPSAVVRPLLASRAEVRDHRRTEREERLLPDAVDPVLPQAPAREASGGDDEFDALEETEKPAGSATGGLIAVLLSGALSCLGMYKLLGAPAIAGGSLLAPGTFLDQAWERATSFIQPTSLGQAGPPDPFDLLIWLVQALTFGHAQTAGAVLWLLAMPVAALCAWFALGALTRSAGLRFLGAVAWALVPSLQVSLAQGRPGAVLVHVLLPLLMLALIRAVGAARTETSGGHVPGAGGTPSWAATAAASLLGIAVVAAEPLLILPLVLGCVIAVFVSSRSRNLWWVPIPALLASAPLLVHAVTSPRALLVQPGAPQDADPAPVWQQLLGWPSDLDLSGDVPGLPVLGSGWIWVAVLAAVAPLAILALVALLAPRRGTARVLVLIGLVTLAGGVAVSRLDATVAGDEIVTPYTGSFVSVFVLTVLLAAGSGRDVLSNRERGRRPTTALLGSLIGIGTLVSAVVWVAPNVVPGQERADALSTAQQVAKAPGSPLPATSADRGTGKYQERTLVLDVADNGDVSAEVADGAGTRLEDLSAATAAAKLDGSVFLPHTTERAEAGDGTEAVRSVVAALASGAETDVRADLADLAVSSISLKSGGNSSEVLSRILDAVPGLSAVGRSDSDDAWIWWVDSAAGAPKAVSETGSSTARARVLSAEGVPQRLLPNTDGAIDRRSVPSGEDGRTLVISENADPGWKAELNGTELEKTDHDWAQAWKLPASGGTLSVKYSSPWKVVWLIGLGLGLLVALLSVVPVPRAWRVDARSARVYRATVAERGSPEESGALQSMLGDQEDDAEDTPETTGEERA